MEILVYNDLDYSKAKKQFEGECVNIYDLIDIDWLQDNLVPRARGYFNFLRSYRKMIEENIKEEIRDYQLSALMRLHLSNPQIIP